MEGPAAQNTQIFHSPQQQAQLFRIDKNIAKQGVDFINTYGKEGQLIYDISLYIAESFQNGNLFNFGILEVKDFADKLGYNLANLQRTHPEPEQLKNRINPITDPNERFTSVIENALFKAANTNLSFTSKVKDYTNNEEITELQFYQLITTLRKHTSKQRKNVSYYTFEVSETFTYHLSKFFTYSSFEKAKALRKNRNVFLYLYLRTLEEAQRADPKDKVNATPYFDVLCDKAGIKIKKPTDAKLKLDTKLRYLKEYSDINFDYKFYNRSGKYDYGVKISFFDNIGNLSAQKSELRIELADKALNDMALYNIVKAYRDKYQKLGRLNQIKFNAWFLSGKDIAMKEGIYFETAAKLKNITLSHAERKYKRLAEVFLSKLPVK